MMSRKLFLILMVLVLVACGDEEGGEEAQSFLPALENYNTIDGENLSTALQAVGAYAAIQADPRMAGIVVMTDEFLDCAAEQGAVATRMYHSQSNPVSAGVVAVVNTERLAAFDSIVRCMLGDAVSFRTAVARPEPCYDAWTYTRDNVEYWMMYAGTEEEICTDFAEDLPR